jgi:hypothetical protein
MYYAAIPGETTEKKGRKIKSNHLIFFKTYGKNKTFSENILLAVNPRRFAVLVYGPARIRRQITRSSSLIYRDSP